MGGGRLVQPATLLVETLDPVAEGLGLSPSSTPTPSPHGIPWGTEVMLLVPGLLAPPGEPCVESLPPSVTLAQAQSLGVFGESAQRWELPLFDVTSLSHSLSLFSSLPHSHSVLTIFLSCK